MVISHEIGFAKAWADRAILMDGGKIIEEAPPQILFNKPKHERTKAFLSKILWLLLNIPLSCKVKGDFIGIDLTLVR